MIGPLVVYVSGPLSGDVSANVHRANLAGVELLRRGHCPVIPHLYVALEHYVRLAGFEVGYEDWMAHDFLLLERCDALLFLGNSPGADRERVRALELGLPVYQAVELVPIAG